MKGIDTKENVIFYTRSLLQLIKQLRDIKGNEKLELYTKTVIEIESIIKEFSKFINAEMVEFKRRSYLFKANKPIYRKIY